MNGYRATVRDTPRTRLAGSIAAWPLALGLFGLTALAIVQPDYLFAELAFGAIALVMRRFIVELLTAAFSPAHRATPEDRRRRAAEFRSAIECGTTALEREEYDDALARFESAEALFPGRLVTTLRIADALRRQERFADALGRLDDAMTHYAGRPSLHLAAARVACLAGDLERAKDEIELAASIDPECWLQAIREPDLAILIGWLSRRARARGR